MANTSKACRVVTGRHTVFAFLNVVNPKPQLYGNGKPIYSAQLIIPKSDTRTMDKIRDAIVQAITEGQYKLQQGFEGPVKAAELELPVHDGDIERPGVPEYKDAWFINANNRRDKPSIVDKDLNHIYDSKELYSGIIGRASIQFYAFNSGGIRGIACSLGNIQKLENGPILASHPTAEDDFAEED